MAWRRVFGATGKVLMGAGVVLLLFVAYQLWGTGIETRAAQSRLEAAFVDQLGHIDRSSGSQSNGNQSIESGSPDTAVEAGTEDAAVTAALASISTGDPVARLEIPAIEVDYIVSMGVDLDTLRAGPGLFPSNPLPGQPGNAAIAGHRATFDAPFNRLDELRPGDEVVVTTIQGTFRYDVIAQPAPTGNEKLGHYLVEPTAVEILDDRGDDRITLMGCHPRYGATQRIVVEAALVDDTAPVTPVAVQPAVPNGESIELLSGERGSWAAAAGWSAAVLAVVGLAVGAARRWNRVVVYVLATPVAAVVLLQAFAAVSDLSAVAY